MNWYYQDETIIYEVNIPQGIKAKFIDSNNNEVLLNEGKNRLFEAVK